MNSDTFTKSKLEKINSDPKYGFNWIKNIHNLSNEGEFKIYATKHATISSGREYMAFPANQILSKEDKEKNNLM